MGGPHASFFPLLNKRSKLSQNHEQHITYSFLTQRCQLNHLNRITLTILLILYSDSNATELTTMRVYTIFLILPAHNITSSCAMLKSLGGHCLPSHTINRATDQACVLVSILPSMYLALWWWSQVSTTIAINICVALFYICPLRSGHYCWGTICLNIHQDRNGVRTLVYGDCETAFTIPPAIDADTCR